MPSELSSSWSDEPSFILRQLDFGPSRWAMLRKRHLHYELLGLFDSRDEALRKYPGAWISARNLERDERHDSTGTTREREN